MKLTNLAIKKLIKEELRRFLLQEQEASAEYSVYDSADMDDIEDEGRLYSESELNAMNTTRLKSLNRKQRATLRKLKKKEREAFKDEPEYIREKCKKYTSRYTNRSDDDRPDECRTGWSKYYGPIARSIRRLSAFIQEREDGTRTFEPKKASDMELEDRRIFRRQATAGEPCNAGAYSTPAIGAFAYERCMRGKGQRTEKDISAVARKQQSLETELERFRRAGKRCNNADPAAPSCPEGSRCYDGECKKIPGWTGDVVGKECTNKCEKRFSQSWLDASEARKPAIRARWDQCLKRCGKLTATGTEYEDELRKANLEPNCGAGCPPGTVCTSFGAPRGQKTHCVKISVMQSAGVRAYKDKYRKCLQKPRGKVAVVLPTCDNGCPPGSVCSKGKCVSLASMRGRFTPRRMRSCERKAGYFSRKARKLAATGIGAGPRATTGAGPGRPSVPGATRARRISAAYRRGLPILKKEGYNSYQEFYAALKAKGLMGELGPRGQDQKWGPYHRAALKALKGMATTAAPAGSPEFNQRLAPEKDISPHGTAGYPERGCGDSKGGYAPGVSRDGAGDTVSWWQCVQADKK